MTLEQCYAAFGGSYEDIKGRLGNDALIERFARKFLNDGNFAKLRDSIEAGDYGEAFRAAHTLKGVCQNLSFQRLAASCGELTEELRHYETEPVDAGRAGSLLDTVSEDYALVVDSLGLLDG